MTRHPDFLHDALIDLAAIADRQAACAAHSDSATASSTLFRLADQLRAAAALTQTIDATSTKPVAAGSPTVLTSRAPHTLPFEG